MAQCQADHKKHSTSRFDLYGGIFSGQLYGTNTAGNGHVDRMQSCPSFRMGPGENFVTRESNLSSIGCSFREETGMRTAGLRKSDSLSANGFGGYGANSPAATGGGIGTGSLAGAGGLYSSSLDRRKSTGGIIGQKTPFLSPDVSPVAPSKAAVAPSKAAGGLGGAGGGGGGGGGVQNGSNHGNSGNNSRNLHSSNTKEHGLGTPPVHNHHRHHSGHNHSHNHSRKSSGEVFPQFVGSDHRNHAKGGVIHADGFAFGEIIKGVGNLCDDLSNSSSKPNSDHETGSNGAGSGDGGSRKGRSSRADSPKSIGSSSSGGSCASGGSPSAERVVNFGNILPSGGLKSTSNGNHTHNASSTPASNNSNSNSNSSSLAIGGVGSVSGRVGPGGGGLGGGHSNGGNGLAPVPVPTADSGGSRGNRRSNSWDYATGGTHNKVAHARSGSETCSVGYTHAAAANQNQTVGATPRGGSLSTSPSGSFGSSSIMENGQAGSKVQQGGGGGMAKGGSFGSSTASENLMIRNALASMDAEKVKNAGNEQYKKGHFVEALNLYDKAIFLAPDKAPLRSNRAAALTGLGRVSEAMLECLQAVRLDPNYARAHHRLATLYLRLGQIDNAAKHFRAAGSQTEWTDTQRSLGVEKHLRKCQDARKAMDWDTLLRETDATIIAGADCAPQVIAFKAEALLKLHRPEEADSVMTNIRKCEELLRRSALAPINCIVLTVQAQIDMELGRFENAVSAAEKASQCAPNDFNVTVLLRKARTVSQARNLGNDLFKARKFTEAIVAYGEGLESAPKNAVLLCNRAACRSKLNQWEKAVEDSNAALEAQPNYTKALLRRAQSHAQLERWEPALRDYEVLRRKLPEDPEVAKALFDVQVALKRSKGEDTYKIRRFGGDVVEVVTNDQFREAITAPGLAVVQFSTRWSERCKEIAPFVEDLSKRHLYITFLKVDVDDHPYLAKLENVSFVPTYKIYKNGSKMKEIAGPTQEDLERAISPFS